MQEDGKKSVDEKPKKRFSIVGLLSVITTVTICIMLVSTAVTAYAEGIEAKDKKKDFDSMINSLQRDFDRETKQAISNLDPDYRRAVRERERGILAPGEELLPIYDESDNE